MEAALSGGVCHRTVYLDCQSHRDRGLCRLGGPPFIWIVNLIGTVAFAASGALTGLKKGMDLFGVCILGLVTAVGGGVIRDLILGLTPPMALG